MSDTTPDQRAELVEHLSALRQPFPDSEIGKLPRLWCKACRDSRERHCEQHPSRRCNECGNTHSTAALHLDYVGHAETTDRLLSVDPEWSWEPMARDGNGLPVLDGLGGLWIYLTVCGVTRPGYGHAGDKKGGDAIKECIGDAIRNAAMRFGVALDLWRKTDHITDPEPASEPAVGSGRRTRPARTDAHVEADLKTRMEKATSVDELVDLARQVATSTSLAESAKALLHDVYDTRLATLTGGSDVRTA